MLANQVQAFIWRIEYIRICHCIHSSHELFLLTCYTSNKDRHLDEEEKSSRNHHRQLHYLVATWNEEPKERRINTGERCRQEEEYVGWTFILPKGFEVRNNRNRLQKLDNVCKSVCDSLNLNLHLTCTISSAIIFNSTL
jgi:hypothetical protein